MAEKRKRVGVRTLKSAEDVRRLVAKLIKARLADEVDTDTLRAVVYGAGLLLKAIEAGQIDERLTALEQAMEGRGK